MTSRLTPFSNHLQLDTLGGHRLMTAHIFYHLPDFPELLQEFVWQTVDHVPEFPRLRRFLTYWEHQLDGKLHSVEVASIDPIPTRTWNSADSLMSIN